MAFYRVKPQISLQVSSSDYMYVKQHVFSLWVNSTLFILLERHVPVTWAFLCTFSNLITSFFVWSHWPHDRKKPRSNCRQVKWASVFLLQYHWFLIVPSERCSWYWSSIVHILGNWKLACSATGFHFFFPVLIMSIAEDSS